MNQEVEEQGSVVENLKSKTARVPWRERTGCPSHLPGILDEEIKSPYKLPKWDGDNDAGFVRNCDVAASALRNVCELCGDTAPERRMHRSGERAQRVQRQGNW